MAEELKDKHVVISASTVADSMEQKRRLYAMSELPKNEPPTIYKVHKNLRQEGQDSYDPKLLSIGPLHHRRPELMHMQPLKWQYLDALISRSPETNTVSRYTQALWNREMEVRSRYSVSINLTWEELLEMLVLDGCFILEFLVKRAVGSVGSPWKDVKWNLPLLRNDLLLLENQIPFFVLEILYDNSRIPFPDDMDISLLDLALHYIGKDKVKDSPSSEIPTPIHHLLHLNHTFQLRFFQPNRQDQVRASCKHNTLRRLSEPVATVFYYLMSLLLMCKLPRHRSSERDAKAPRVFPCAKNLRQAGVKFKRKDDPCYLNVSFVDGTLEMPFLPIQQNTIAQFRNLIAFEQCCPSAGSQFTAYAVFMDQLIDTAEDVGILESHKIVESKLGSNEEVTRLFNGICKGASLDYDKHYLVELFKQLNRHCESDKNRWRAELMQRYFHNPWARVSVFAAIILLVVTILQTAYTMRSYWKESPSPPPSVDPLH